MRDKYKKGDILETVFDDKHNFEVYQYLDEGNSIMLIMIDKGTSEMKNAILLGADSLEDFSFKIITYA